MHHKKLHVEKRPDDFDMRTLMVIKFRYTGNIGTIIYTNSNQPVATTMPLPVYSLYRPSEKEPTRLYTLKGTNKWSHMT